MPEPFDPEDAWARERFLRRGLLDALEALQPDTPAGWGGMTPQQMVEHLAWAFEISTGQAQVPCSTPPEKLERARAFLYSSRAMPREYMNPVLVRGLPPLRHGNLDEARAELRRQAGLFLDRPPGGELFTHPVFGPLDHEGWHRMHYKHAYHHLLQFGLVAGA
jgi:hypothetical protein